MKNNLLFAGLILFGIIFRFLPHPANFTPIGAITLFAFSYFSNKKALFIPLAIMMVTDIFLGYHPTMIWVYGSLVLSGIILNLRKNKTIPNVFAHSLVASFMFYLITNFGVWASSGMYEKSFAGLLDSYYMAIPFFRNSLVGDIVYGVAIFTLYNHSLAITKTFIKASSVLGLNKKNSFVQLLGINNK